MTDSYQINFEFIPEDVVEGKRLGRHRLVDTRSARFTIAAADSSTWQSKTWTRYTPVLDQGNLGSCTGNASTGALGTGPLYDSLKPLIDAGQLVLDENFAVQIYSLATQLDPYRGQYPPTDTGSDGLSAAKAVQSKGLIASYQHATDLNSMITALQTGPVIVGTSWLTGMDNPDGSGVIHATGTVRGGHEWEVNAVDVNAHTFGMINSWGENWGNGGTATISWDDMDKLLQDKGDCTQFVPVAATPNPPPAADPDAELWNVAGPWAQQPRVRQDLQTLKAALNDWHNKKTQG